LDQVDPAGIQKISEAFESGLVDGAMLISLATTTVAVEEGFAGFLRRLERHVFITRGAISLPSVMFQSVLKLDVKI
jgi:hypothetical protein